MNEKKNVKKNNKKNDKKYDKKFDMKNDRNHEKKHDNIHGKKYSPASKCPVSGKCGGCSYIDTDYQKQLDMKYDMVKKLLKPYCEVEGIIGMDNPFHYRNKVHAVFAHKKDNTIISGVYKEGTHIVVPVEKCLIENEKADEIIGTIRRLLPSFKIKTFNEDTGYGFFRHVLIRCGHKTGQIMVVLVVASPIFPSKNNFVKALLKEHPEITTIVMNINDKKTSMVLGEREINMYGKGYIEDILCGKRFKISSKSFYQINSVQTEKLYGKAIEFAGLTGKETVIDAYCGIGTIGIIASEKAGKVIGVELNSDAIADAKKNARMNKIENIDFYNNDAGKFMRQYAGMDSADVVFMDPPRSGSTVEFMDSMISIQPEKIVYVSCDPNTLARDLKYMTNNGYKAVKAVATDMFPMTEHVETVVLMSKVNTQDAPNRDELGDKKEFIDW